MHSPRTVCKVASEANLITNPNGPQNRDLQQATEI